MMRPLGLSLLWISFIIYSFGFAPPEQPDTLALIQRLAGGDWDGINPAIVVLFNLMGIWPLVYAGLALVDGHGQRVPAWPFVVGSFGLGAFLLLPYLVLRSPNPTFSAAGLRSGDQGPSRLLKLLESRWLGVFLTLGAAGLMAYGLYAGDWADFVGQWRTSRFIHVMSLDFCALWLLVPCLLADDMARRSWKSPSILALVMAVPLVGAAAYLAFRPPLPLESVPQSGN
ncbi:hypothetical protein [Leptolyngbya sp. PCC 6406]|uniref:hypothetical protein n=1 Tax=Leptolyngbya sp. PCC 6406 TaxID=1173264 RepID=UPI0002AC08D2|nr:hypothetical protein [Leptolyngbya sp. PCC 6406]